MVNVFFRCIGCVFNSQLRWLNALTVINLLVAIINLA